MQLRFYKQASSVRNSRVVQAKRSSLLELAFIVVSSVKVAVQENVDWIFVSVAGLAADGQDVLAERLDILA